MKNALNIIFNVFWVVFIGIGSAIANLCCGIACCMTIIGIPFGLQYFKFIGLAFAPAGKVVVTDFGKHPIMNLLWLLFGGLASTIAYLLLGVLLAITIIGIPVALQLFKIAKFYVAPFGCTITTEGAQKVYSRAAVVNPDQY